MVAGDCSAPMRCCPPMSVHRPVPVRMLTVCGSLQGRSANGARWRRRRPSPWPEACFVDDFDRLADVPAFDPGRADERIDVVDDWRGRGVADVVLVAAPSMRVGWRAR